MKLIALDLDGTTLNSKREISIKNIEAIKKAQEQGHIVIFLSGRTEESVKNELYKYDLVCPIGANNGTELFVNDELIKQISLSLSQCQKIALEIEQEYLPYKINTDKGIYATSDWSERLEKVISSGLVPEEHFNHRDYDMFILHPKERGHSLFEQHVEMINGEFSIQKLLILTLDPEQRDRLQKKLECVADLSICSSTPFNLEVTHLNGTKGDALKTMAEHFGISMENTIAIGDEKNDISMFQAAGLSISMGNAEDDVKNNSDVVTLTNDEHGVAHALKKYVLES